MPKVSVILSSYNHEKFIAASIESVLNQTYSDFELLIYDDGSVDNSQKIIRSYDDPRIKLFLYEKNRGPIVASRDAVNSAKGKYIAIHHSDDIWESTKLEKQVNFLDTHPEYAACFTQVKFIDEYNQPYILPEGHPYKYTFKQKNRSREEWLNQFFHRMNCLCNPSVLVRNDKKLAISAPYLFQLPDYFMWLNLCKRRNIYVLAEELINFRLERDAQKSMSSLTFEKSVRIANEIYIVVREFLPLLKDRKEFLKIFPEAQRFIVNGRIDTEFAFAQLCLQHVAPGYKQLGLEILHSLMQNPKKAALLKELYHYDERSFIKDTGNCDPFGVRFQAPLMRCRLYFDAKNFMENITYIKPDGSFFVRFDGFLKKNIETLQFSPDDKEIISIKPTQILVNGEQITEVSTNALQFIDGYYRFLGVLPMFKINRRITGKELHVQIAGVVENNVASKLAEVIRNMDNIIKGSRR